MPRGTQVPAPSLWLSNTGLSPSLAELSSSLLLATRESDSPALQPQMNESIWFGLFPVRSPLLGESRLISLPAGTEIPIQRSPDQRMFCSSPRLIAAYHVFHRLPTPRHPPDALLNLFSK